MHLIYILWKIHRLRWRHHVSVDCESRLGSRTKPFPKGRNVSARLVANPDGSEKRQGQPREASSMRRSLLPKSF